MRSRTFTRLVWPVPATATPSLSRPVKEPGRRQPVPMPSPGMGAHLGMYSILPPTPVQAKPTASTPGDRFETEADRVADTVMTMPEPVVQRQAENEEEDTEAGQIQSAPLAEQTTPLVQRQTETEDEEQEATRVQPKGVDASPTPPTGLAP